MVEVTRFNSKLIQFEDFKWFPILRRPLFFITLLKKNRQDAKLRSYI